MSDADLNARLLRAALEPRHKLKSTNTRNRNDHYETTWVCTCGKSGTVRGMRAAGEEAHRSHRWYR
ncbi:hypothetical protein [Streptomyces sp. H39-S7]|uniref:hypothetical protein n=1 Tax=Streptomyces sp. H39-S7 TaxID=3004357 RepID=UPI0022AE8F1A|nr:hypothetical protein [Streptomyces sp. H39-S7]MCZ4123475.1 hypothetical protein [Streptomyces sp. H39-S7]